MTKTLSDVEVKTMEILDGIQGITKRGKSLKFWLLVPVALVTVATGSYFIVRRVFGGHEK